MREPVPQHGEVAFTDDERAEAYLLAGFPSDRSAWTDGMNQTIANVRAMSLFFCPAMRALKRRGNIIQRVCQEPAHGLPKVTRRPFNDLSSGEAVTLDAIVQVNNTLKAIHGSRNTAVRAATKINIDGKMRSLTLDENAVIPSYVWVNYPSISEFRNRFGEIGRKKMGEILFGDGEYDNFFHRIEDGEKKRGIKYDYRVTPFTADLILTALKVIYDELPSLRGGQFDDEPTFGQFFDTSHTAGLGAYKKAKPLPLHAGNLSRQATPRHIQDVVSRARSTTAKIKEKIEQKRAAE